ncbi:MAG: SCO family protein [Vicinamibacterales bacterium]
MKTMCALLLASLAAGACSKPAPAKRYELTGQILGLRPEARELMVKHDDIKGFMPAMTMPYKVSDLSLLEGKAPGDLITATLEVGENQGILTAITKTGHADLPAAPEEQMLTPMAVLVEGDAVPEEILFDQDGKARPVSSFKGKTVALTFTYTRCPMPDFCPLMDRNFATVQVALKKSPELAHVRLASVTIDPAHDTPAVLKAHAATLKADPAVWTFLTGDEINLSHFAAQFGLSVMRNDKDPSDISHTLRTVVIGPDGKIAKTFSGNHWTPAELLASLKAVPASAH